MKSIKMRGICAAVTGALLFGFGANAMADSTTDIVNALVAKGVLTEEEGALLNKGREGEAAGQAKALKKAGKLTVSDAIDNATIYGDVRVRYEDRLGNGLATASGVIGDENRQRGRYKVVFGAKTTSGDFYTDLAFSTGAYGRSDNATFAGSSASGGAFATAANGLNTKEGLFVKRAYVGWNLTPWLAVEAGRIENPLYTTSMVWDADLVFEGLAEKFKYKYNDNLDLFANLVQSQYLGDKKGFPDGTGVGTVTNEFIATQVGAKYAFTPKTSAKAAVTYMTYTHGGAGLAAWTPVPYTALASATVSTANTNFLDIWEIPAEVNTMITDSIGLRGYGEYVWNASADDRAIAGGQAGGSTGSQDVAWLLGAVVGSAKDLKSFESNKMAKGDWSARLWYQQTGIWALDQNAVDSDIFDSRINMKGVAFKGQYNIQDNVMANFTYAHGSVNDKTYAAMYSAGADLGLNVHDMDLFQFDLTYKF